MNIRRHLSICALALCLSLPAVSMAASAPILKKEKLQIVFCFGQSNMVGLADPSTAWYLTQPQYLPPREQTLQKTRFFDWNFYWSGLRYYEGPKKSEKEGREFTPRPAPQPGAGNPWCWELAMPHVEKVLTDPGKFHPGYDPEVGYEVAGLV